MQHMGFMQCVVNSKIEYPSQILNTDLMWFSLLNKSPNYLYFIFESTEGMDQQNKKILYYSPKRKTF